MIDFLIKSSVSLNTSALAEYNQQLNKHASLREHLLSVAANLEFIDAGSIKILASSLAGLTNTTSELTRTASVSSLYSLFSHKI